MTIFGVYYNYKSEPKLREGAIGGKPRTTVLLVFVCGKVYIEQVHSVSTNFSDKQILDFRVVMLTNNRLHENIEAQTCRKCSEQAKNNFLTRALSQT